MTKKEKKPLSGLDEGQSGVELVSAVEDRRGSICAKIEESRGIEEKYHQEASVVLFGKKKLNRIVKCQVKIKLMLRKKDGENKLIWCRL